MKRIFKIILISVILALPDISLASDIKSHLTLRDSTHIEGKIIKANDSSITIIADNYIRKGKITFNNRNSDSTISQISIHKIILIQYVYSDSNTAGINIGGVVGFVLGAFAGWEVGQSRSSSGGTFSGSAKFMGSILIYTPIGALLGGWAGSTIANRPIRKETVFDVTDPIQWESFKLFFQNNIDH